MWHQIVCFNYSDEGRWEVGNKFALPNGWFELSRLVLTLLMDNTTQDRGSPSEDFICSAPLFIMPVLHGNIKKISADNII